MYLRNGVRAIIVEERKLLAIRNRDVDGFYYVLPGGAQRPGETLVETVQREVREETGADAEVGPLRHVREYIGKHHEFADRHADVHGVIFFFDCRLTSPPDASRRTEPDLAQVGVEWLELDRLASYDLWPKALVPLLVDPEVRGSVYLGDVN